MNKLSTITLLCAVVMNILASCSSDTVVTLPVVADKNYYPTKVGNVWVYDGIDTEDTSKAGTVSDIASSMYTATSTVKDSLTYMGRATAMIISTYSNGKPNDTSYISKTGTQIYQYYPLLPTDALSGFGINLDLGSRWVLAADYNQASWVTIDTTITGLNIPFNGTNVPADVKLKISSSKAGTTTMMIAGSSVTAQEFTTTFTISISALSGVVQVPISVTIKKYVAENIGIVKTESIPFSFAIPALLGGGNFHNNGNRETIKTYTVVK